MDNVFQMSVGSNATIIAGHRVAGMVVGENLYVLAPSSSRYTLHAPGDIRRSFCCQDGCCDAGLRPDVANLVEVAKAIGARRIVLRTGQYNFRLREIAGLPVDDVSRHVGQIGDDLFVDDRR